MGSADPIQIQNVTPLKMGTKMKFIFKGIKNIFDEEKDQEIEIGLPTDVKHVAHIGWDGSAAVEAPSWMKDFNSPGQFQSAPLNMNGAPREGPEINWVSEDKAQSAESTRDLLEVRKSSRRRHRLKEYASDTEAQCKDSSTKSKHSRKHHSKGSSEGTSKGRRTQDPSITDESSIKLSDVSKKSRRKKSKEGSTGEGSSARSKANDSSKDTTMIVSDF